MSVILHRCLLVCAERNFSYIQIHTTTKHHRIKTQDVFFGIFTVFIYPFVHLNIVSCFMYPFRVPSPLLYCVSCFIYLHLFLAPYISICFLWVFQLQSTFFETLSITVLSGEHSLCIAWFLALPTPFPPPHFLYTSINRPFTRVSV